MSNAKPINNPHPAWDALIHHLQIGQAPEPALIHAAFIEHERNEKLELEALYSEAAELREEWLENALVIQPPKDSTSLEARVEKVVSEHAKTSPKPLVPRFTFLSKIPFIRRFFR